MTELSPKAIEQLNQTVREVTRRVKNETPHRSRWHKHKAASTSQNAGGGLSNCGCAPIETGTVACLDTNDSPEVYVVTGLSAWLTSLGFTDVPDEIELTHDTGCTWISDNLSRDCGYGY